MEQSPNQEATTSVAPPEGNHTDSGWTSLPEPKVNKVMPWRLVTVSVSAIALISSIILMTGKPWQIAMVLVIGLSALVSNVIAIRRSPSKKSKWLLLLTVPTLLWTVGLFVGMGLIFPRIGAGTFSTAAGGYKILIPQGYMGRVETIHGSLVLAQGTAVLGTSSVASAHTVSDIRPVVALVPSPVLRQAYTQALEQVAYNQAITEYQGSGSYVSNSRHISVQNGSVFEMVTRDNATGKESITGSVLLPDRKRMVYVSVSLPIGASTIDGIAIFNEIADSIQQY